MFASIGHATAHGIVNRQARGALAALLVSAAGLLTTTATSYAGHGSCSSRISITLQSGEGFTQGYSHSHRRSFAQRQYDEGFERGHCQGNRDGFNDGYRCRPYCDEPRACLAGYSRHYRAGYEDGYVEAYCEGYREGQRARSRGHSHRRCW